MVDRTKVIRVDTPIDETFEFPQNLAEFNTIKLDFTEATYINSEGTRRLSNWVWELERSSPAKSIQFVNVPSSITRQLILIRINTAHHVEVSSVRVPYFCNNCETIDESTLVRIEDAGKGSAEVNLPSVLCKTCNQPMEIDVIENEYFSVFKKT